MRLDFGHIRVLDDATAALLRSKEPCERLAIGFAIWRDTRKMLTRDVRAGHPDWTAEQIRREVNRRMADQVVWFSDRSSTASGERL